MKRSLLFLFTLMLVTVFFISGCSNKSGYFSEAPTRNAPVEDAKSYNDSYGFTSNEVGGSVKKNVSPKTDQNFNRKRIITTRVTMETKNMDKTLQILQDALNVVGGYVDSSNITKNGTMTNAELVYRVPTDKLNDFKAKLSSSGNITSEKVNSDDITSSYYDTNSRLKVAKITRENLIKLLDKADKLSSILNLQEKIEDKNYEIDQLTGKLRMWDSLMSMSKYTISITEVKALTVKAETFTNKASNAFKGSWKGFVHVCQYTVLAFIWLLPVILIVAFVLVLVFLILRIRKMRKG